MEKFYTFFSLKLVYEDDKEKEGKENRIIFFQLFDSYLQFR